MLNSDQILDRAGALKAQGQAFVIATVVRAESPTSAKPGAKAIVTTDGELLGWIGGGCAQPAVLDTARKALADGRSRLIRVSPKRGTVIEPGILDFGMTCHSGGTLDIFIDPVIARPALAIVGTSPVAQTLAVLAHRTGFAVHAAGAGATTDLFPDAVDCLDGLQLDGLSGAAPAFVIVATQGKRDETALKAALALEPDYLGFVASARKAAKIKEQLRRDGCDPAQVARIVAPVGIEIGAITPEEIAVSVLGALVQARRLGQVVDRAGAERQPRAGAAGLSAGSPAGSEDAACCGDTAEPAAEPGRSDVVGTGCCGDTDQATTSASPTVQRVDTVTGCCGGSAERKA